MTVCRSPVYFCAEYFLAAFTAHSFASAPELEKKILSAPLLSHPKIGKTKPEDPSAPKTKSSRERRALKKGK